jgi:hypothetical protein
MFFLGEKSEQKPRGAWSPYPAFQDGHLPGWIKSGNSKIESLRAPSPAAHKIKESYDEYY